MCGNGGILSLGSGKRTSSCPVQKHWAQQMYKINYWHQYILYNWRFTKLYISQKDHRKLEKNVRKTCLLLCSMDGMWPKIVLTTHEREWRNPVSWLWSTVQAMDSAGTRDRDVSLRGINQLQSPEQMSRHCKNLVTEDFLNCFVLMEMYQLNFSPPN